MKVDLPAGAEPFAHPALFYANAGEYLAGTVGFITDGLAKGEPVAVSVPPANLALLRRELGASADHVRLLDMTAVGRNPGRIIPGVLRAFADGNPGRRVRIIGEPVWAGRSAAEYPACVQHEALINHAFAGRQATILCPYDTATLDPRALADAARTHPVLMDAEGSRESAEYAPENVVADYNLPLDEPGGAISYAVTVAGLKLVREAAKEQALRLGMSDDRAEDVMLVVTELATNSVEHGGGHATVLFGKDGDSLVCQVRDGGCLADPLAGRRPEVRGQFRGRGLLLVNHLADLVRMHTTPGGTCVEAWFDLKA